MRVQTDKYTEAQMQTGFIICLLLYGIDENGIFVQLSQTVSMNIHARIMGPRCACPSYKGSPDIGNRLMLHTRTSLFLALEGLMTYGTNACPTTVPVKCNVALLMCVISVLF